MHHKEFDDRVTFEKLKAKLDGVIPRGDNAFTAFCFCQEQRKNRSLSVSLGDTGKLLVKCHGGCTTAFERCLELAGDDRDFTPTAVPAKSAKPKTEPRETSREKIAEHVYQDANGKPYGMVRRFKVTYADGTVNAKAFKQLRYAGGKWEYGAPPAAIVYRLPEVLAAIANGETVYIVEGEKDVETLQRLGLTATCNAGGCNGWKPAHAKFLANADVVILPDNDKCGREFGDRAAASLVDFARSLRAVILPVPNSGNDVSDWVAIQEMGKSTAEVRDVFLGLVDNIAVKWERDIFTRTPLTSSDNLRSTPATQSAAADVPMHEQPMVSTPPTGKASFIRATDALAAFTESLFSGKPPVRWHVDADENNPINQFGMRPGAVIVLGGSPGAGKTAFLLETIYKAMTLDASLKTLLVNVEMSAESLLERLLASQSGVNLDTIINHKVTEANGESIVAALDAIHAVAGRFAFGDSPFTIENIRDTIAECDPKIVVIDYAQRIRLEKSHAGLSARDRINILMEHFRAIAAEGRCVIAVSAVARDNSNGKDSGGHKKGLAAFRDSSELEYGADDAWIIDNLTKDEQQAMTGGASYNRVLRCHKKRNGRMQDVKLTFDKGIQSFTAEANATEWNAGGVDTTTKAEFSE